MIKKFGDWYVDELGLSFIPSEYEIHYSNLWKTKKFNGVEIWDWIYHLSEKKFIDESNVTDFNNAFIFAQDYFKKHKPQNTKNISIEGSLKIQTLLLKNKKLNLL